MSGTGVTGVGIGGPIKPLGLAQKHVFEDEDGWGGFRVVADATARDAVYADCQKVGMWVFQLDTLTVYRLTATGSPPTYAAVSFGAGAPGGTGFVKVASGVFAVVAALDVAADTGSSTLPSSRVSGLTTAINAAIAAYTSLTASQVSDFGTAVTARIAATAPTGDGFARYTGGVRATAAQKVDLVNDIQTSTVLPGANGGGVVCEVVQLTTTDATPTLVTAAAKTLTAWQQGDFLLTILARTGAGSTYRVELLATYVANAGGPVVLTPVNPPTLQNGYGSLTGLAMTFDVTAGVVTPKVTGLAGTTILWDITQVAKVV